MTVLELFLPLLAVILLNVVKNNENLEVNTAN